MRPLSCCNR